MLDQLKFALRGVAKSDSIPHLRHLRIHNGRVTASDGVLAMSSPVALSFDAAPLATPFVNALAACDEQISITQESVNKIIVRSGNFQAFVPCIDPKRVPETKPEGQAFMPVDIVAAFRALRPFVCSDSSKPSVCGILLTGESAYATTNVTVCQYWLGTPFPFDLNIPVSFVDEVLKIKEEPRSIQMCKNSVTFHYSDERWIRTQLNALEWPHVAEVLNKAWEGSAMIPVDPKLKEAVQKLADFGGEKITFNKDQIETEGAVVAVECPQEGSYFTKFLMDVLRVAEEVDWGRYPLPVAFSGNKVRGVLVGVRE